MIHTEPGLAVVIEHPHLGVPDFRDIIPYGLHTFEGIGHIGNVAGQVDQYRNDYKERDAPGADPEGSAPCGTFLVLA